MAVNWAGEQDESAFDISQLKKPIDSPRGRLRAPAVEKVMPPPIPSTNRPTKWGRCCVVRHLSVRLSVSTVLPSTSANFGHSITLHCSVLHNS